MHNFPPMIGVYQLVPTCPPSFEITIAAACLAFGACWRFVFPAWGGHNSTCLLRREGSSNDIPTLASDAALLCRGAEKNTNDCPPRPASSKVALFAGSCPFHCKHRRTLQEKIR